MTPDTATLIPLEGVDPAMIEQLLDRAFGPERRQRTAYMLREGVDWLPALSFAALDADEMLVGTIQAWPVALTDPQGRPHPLIMVGPVAVLPEHQNEGFGHALMLAQAGAMDPRAAIPQFLIGDAPYYGKFGFTADHTTGWQCPGPWAPERLLVRTDNPAVLPREGMLGPWKS
ncbi:GNAT family N-acetyltransferase [Alteraurantiacibacter aquimixticola]|uniref:N-acetyltransferase n=1 Tax=Alteraurantiacibacter aquimixticola TaxID=2489173 RepID=A0A4T3F5Z1_9SPHN|nr:N-acetyltransferase [Alteraurantiacibacter aquimixticola]TIX51814.1 N-acetyltransferase [Alteraurantiacibacter aquimixticola]